MKQDILSAEEISYIQMAVRELSSINWASNLLNENKVKQALLNLKGYKLSLQSVQNLPSQDVLDTYSNPVLFKLNGNEIWVYSVTLYLKNSFKTYNRALLFCESRAIKKVR